MASDRIRRYLNLTVMFLISLFFGMGMLYAFMKEDVYDVCGITFPLAVGAKFSFFFTIPLMFLLMCRTLLTRVSFLSFINNHHIAYHITTGWVIFFFTILHVASHLNNFRKLSHVSADELNSLIGTNYKSTPNIGEFLFQEGTGITGVVALICFAGIMVTSFSRWLRATKFGTFLCFHFLFIPFILVLCIHGMWHLIAFPVFPFIMFPVLVIYCIDRVFQVTKARWHAELESAQIDKENILSLSLQVSEDFRYQPGQFIYLTIPEISRFSHPITLTSAPMDKTISVNIRGVGNWTKELIKRCKEDGGKGLTFVVEGPYGGMLKAVANYKRVIFIATGIGATPFSSILKDLHLGPDEVGETDRYLDPEWREKVLGLQDELKTYFFWMNYSEGGFQWFSRLLNEIESRNEKKQFEGHTYLTKAYGKHSPNNFFLLLGMYLYFEAYQVDVMTGLDFLPHWGRPDWTTFFRDIAKSGDDRVGVFMCGPPQLARSVMSAAQKCDVRCDFYQEAFGY